LDQGLLYINSQADQLRLLARAVEYMHHKRTASKSQGEKDMQLIRGFGMG